MRFLWPQLFFTLSIKRWKTAAQKGKTTRSTQKGRWNFALHAYHLWAIVDKKNMATLRWPFANFTPEKVEIVPNKSRRFLWLVMTNTSVITWYTSFKTRKRLFPETSQISYRPIRYVFALLVLLVLSALFLIIDLIVEIERPRTIKIFVEESVD